MTVQELSEFTKSGEEFYLVFGSVVDTYKCVDGEVLYKDKFGNWVISMNDMEYFMSAILVRKPWVPNVGEIYWRWALHNPDFGYDNYYCYTETKTFTGSNEEIANCALGNCFQTEESCRHSELIRSKILSFHRRHERKANS